MIQLKTISQGIILCSLILGFSIFFAHFLIQKTSDGKVFSTPENIPKNKVGVILGTAKILKDGRLNRYYLYRINATVELFKAGKIENILVSGDNSSKNYDEPTTIKKDLMENGIPEEKIYLDYAGFRTLDSIVRSREIFGQQSITIISQEFHNRRAIFLAEKNNIFAVGYNAQDVELYYGLQVVMREYLARVKTVLDVWFGKTPKFKGEKIEIH